MSIAASSGPVLPSVPSKPSNVSSEGPEEGGNAFRAAVEKMRSGTVYILGNYSQEDRVKIVNFPTYLNANVVKKPDGKVFIEFNQAFSSLLRSGEEKDALLSNVHQNTIKYELRPNCTFLINVKNELKDNDIVQQCAQFEEKEQEQAAVRAQRAFVLY